MIKESIILFGEVLFDHFPDGKRILGGAPFNVAWHLQAFKQMPDFISRIGCDEPGNQIQAEMKSWGMDTRHLQQDLIYPTGQVKVVFDCDEPAYEILADQAYDQVDAQNLEPVNYSGILYHGTLAVRSPVSKQALEAIKSTHEGTIFLDVNLRKPWWNKDDVFKFINDANWLKLNSDEINALEGNIVDIKACMAAYLSNFDLDGIIVTSGKSGALALQNNGNFYSVTPDCTVTFVDSVGAGDAFSAVILLGLNLDWDLKLTIERAQDFASAITGQTGAIVNEPGFYTPFIKAWEL